MPNYRRFYVPGGTYFFTLVTRRRRPTFADARAVEILGRKFRECQADWPFTINALVLLPDHLHAIWTLPPGDDGYSQRWGWIKKEFTKEWLAAGGEEAWVSPARRRRHDRGIWQTRFWEHTIEDEHDFDQHFDYTHYNPVKHGHARCPRDWPHSSFHRWVREGVYEPEWGCLSHGVLDFSDLDETAMEME